MKNSIFSIASVLMLVTSPLWANPVDLTGSSCHTFSSFGTVTWEFYGDVAIRYYEDGTMQRFPRIGDGAYEKYDREGQINAVFYFFDVGDGVQLRILARPGLLVREENPTAPLEIGIVNLNFVCEPLWDVRP